MVAQLKQYIELRGNNPYDAVITGTNLKAVLVAQFALSWSVDEAIENYTLSPAEIYSALAFYHDNLDSIKQHEETFAKEMSSLEVESQQRFDELKARYDKLKNDND